MGGEGGRVAVRPWHVLSLVSPRDSKEVPAEGAGFEQEQCVMWDITAGEGLKHC